MILTLINANLEFEHLDHKLSEFIYQLENKTDQVHYIHLKHVDTKDCQKIQDLVSNSDIAIYVSPLDSEVSQERLKDFLNHFDGKHPKTFLVLDSNDLLSVTTVTNYIEMFEKFAASHEAKIIDVKYYKDAFEGILN